ncbi:flagellar biosynthesis protein FlhF [Helicobacter sp. 11S02629-2]|uniref:flagellar biosynthesis protein FlhF n=1 Tax=Helicobacter sp. 11S02629-2 TaxID=1476195 RepID=UPI000BA7DD84|nr:flagellar biosynthesis protein FlhF [Helicobacter sp. 11S02629-2]PAF46039.1 flagellar biosynthesis protein FlhF [Helicobacter sp. 11S02629-2]
MKLYTYGGSTPNEALKKAQADHGDEALVVENKEIRKQTLNSPGLYEVVVAVRDESEKTPKAEPQIKEAQSNQIKKTNSMQERLDAIVQKEIERKKLQKKMEIFSDDSVSLMLSNAVREISEISGQEGLIKNETLGNKDITYKPGIKSMNQDLSEKSLIERSLTEKTLNDRIDSKIQERQMAKTASTNFAGVEEVRSIKLELDKLNDKMKLIQNMVWEASGPNDENLQIPHEFAEIYRITKNSGIAKAHLDSIMKLSLDLMPLKMRENSLTIKRYFREVLRKMILCRPESKDMTKKIIMLVGPTGVGKTTALAKLAARFSLEKKAKVGIITLDSYRIGALEQLQWYADRMRISIQMVMASEDFLKALDSLRHCDYILIDTAGHSQNDSEKIAQIKNFLQNDYKISIHLVMSATTKLEDLRDIYDAFNILNIDTLIFSKIDESKTLGNIFSLAYETKKPISYFSIGQEVPVDLIVASNEALADWILDGFVNPNK